MRSDPINLSKNEMLMVMHDQEQEIEKLKAKVNDLQTQLDDYELKFSEAGSLAEISAHIAKLFDAAQYTANIYLENIKKKSEKTDEVLAELEKQADAIISEAEEIAKKRLETANNPTPKPSAKAGKSKRK